MSRPSGAIELHDVTFIRDGRELLRHVDLGIGHGEHWALLGANGAGKSLLLNICGAVTFPSRGWVRILGSRMGEVDLRDLRRSIGFVNPRHPLRSDLSSLEIALTGITATIELVPRWRPSDDELDRARTLLKQIGFDDPDLPRWHTMSQGERARTLIARALMNLPSLLLLDEPSTGLDLVGRERMLETIDSLPRIVDGLTTVTVTHHLEELPTTVTHAALVAHGALAAAGLVDDVLTSEQVSAAFEHPITVGCANGRWTASAART